jgi:hypothetical protein
MGNQGKQKVPCKQTFCFGLMGVLPSPRSMSIAIVFYAQKKYRRPLPLR